MSIEDLVEDKELVVVMTEAQYVKAVSASSFKTQVAAAAVCPEANSNKTTSSDM